MGMGNIIHLDLPQDAVRRVVEGWKREHEDEGTFRARLGSLVTKDFRYTSFSSPFVGPPYYSPAVVTGRRGDQARVLVVDSSAAHDVNMALVVRDEDGRWKVKAIDYLCLGCFGTGFIETTVCSVCGGTGWGVPD